MELAIWGDTPFSHIPCNTQNVQTLWLTFWIWRSNKRSQAQVSGSWFLFPGREGLNPDWIISSFSQIGILLRFGPSCQKTRPKVLISTFQTVESVKCCEITEDFCRFWCWGNHWGSSGRLKKPWNHPRRPATSNSIRNLISSRHPMIFMLSKAPWILTGWWLSHPSEKYESQLGWWHSQYDGKNRHK